MNFKRVKNLWKQRLINVILKVVFETLFYNQGLKLTFEGWLNTQFFQASPNNDNIFFDAIIFSVS